MTIAYKRHLQPPGIQASVAGCIFSEAVFYSLSYFKKKELGSIETITLNED